jgi:hypothetical protein
MWFFLWMVSVHALLPNGFFGMIGPHVKTSSSLYHLFTTNGILQGVFLHNSTVTPISHLIQTEKVQFEQSWFPLPSDIHHLPWQMLLSHFHVFPSMGTANTAVLSIHDQEYALFERDLPYPLHIDLEARRISTLPKINAPVHSLSAHSWYDTYLYSHTYSILHQTVSFMIMNDHFDMLRMDTFRTRYVPLIHSHLRVRDHYLFTDSPLVFSWKHVLCGEFPFQAKPLPTYIHVTPDVYTSPETFFIFHYASLLETPDTFILYAPVYDTLDFSTTEMYGKYRRLILHKSNKTITMEKKEIFERYNLDFPISWKNYTLLRNIDLPTQRINGFILCDGFTILKEFWFSFGILGEPCIENDSLFFFASNQTGIYFIHLPILSGIQKEYFVDIPGTLGFHSFFKRSK